MYGTRMKNISWISIKFKMDLGTIIAGIFMTAVCILPFVIMRRNRQKREKQLLNAISEIADGHNCKITQHETCANKVLGLAENDEALLFFKKGKEQDVDVKVFIDLSRIRKCSVLNTKRVINSAESIIERLELSFTSVNTREDYISIELFNLKEDYQLDGELQLAERWATMINQTLN